MSSFHLSIAYQLQQQASSMQSKLRRRRRRPRETFRSLFIRILILCSLTCFFFIFLFVPLPQVPRGDAGRFRRRQNGARVAVHDVRVHAHIRRQSW